MIDFSPAIIMVVAALLIAVTRGPVRTGVLMVDYTIEPVEGSPVRRLFATVFAGMALLGGLFAYRIASWQELAAAFAYAGGAIGVCFAGDLITLFLFWEVMALFSTVIVWCGGTPAAREAGIRYAIMHLLGGVILKVGIEGVVISTGSVDIRPFLATDFNTWMILIGLLINAAAPPISAWLADAYPESSATGTVFLSAFTTKTAVLALILLFPGEPVLIGVGLYMIMYGIIYALLENDARRILAYSIVNQVGFMVCAVGIGTEIALNGAAAHAFAHIIYKALLLMSAGVVLYRTGKSRCTDLGGLFRTMPLTCICGIIGALSISGFPLTSGFTTKTLISQAAANQELVFTYMMLTAASAGVFLHAGIKFPWFVFFQKDSGLRPDDAPWNMALAMVLASAVCILLGIFPEPLYALLPHEMDYQAYQPGKVVFYLQLLLFSGLAFFVLLPLMKRTETISLDTDWLWRRLGFGIARGVGIGVGATGRLLTGQRRNAEGAIQALTVKYFGQPQTADSAEKSVFARSWQIGTTALWIALLLSAYILLYYR